MKALGSKSDIFDYIFLALTFVAVTAVGFLSLVAFDRFLGG